MFISIICGHYICILSWYIVQKYNWTKIDVNKIIKSINNTNNKWILSSLVGKIISALHLNIVSDAVSNNITDTSQVLFIMR